MAAECVPCAAKELLNGLARETVDKAEKIRKEVERMHRKGQIDDDGALAILEPLMDSDRAYVAHGKLALEKATQALTAAKNELEK